MNRKQFFGNLIGLAGVAASAKAIAKIAAPASKIEVAEYQYGGKVMFTNKIQFFREITEIKDLS